VGRRRDAGNRQAVPGAGATPCRGTVTPPPAYRAARKSKRPRKRLLQKIHGRAVTCCEQGCFLTCCCFLWHIHKLLPCLLYAGSPFCGRQDAVVAEISWACSSSGKAPREMAFKLSRHPFYEHGWQLL